MKQPEQSSTPSATPTKRFYKFRNVITFTSDVTYPVEAESFDAAIKELQVVAQVVSFDDMDMDPDDFMEMCIRRCSWKCQELDADGNVIAEQEHDASLKENR